VIELSSKDCEEVKNEFNEDATAKEANLRTSLNCNCSTSSSGCIQAPLRWVIIVGRVGKRLVQLLLWQPRYHSRDCATPRLPGTT